MRGINHRYDHAAARHTLSHLRADLDTHNPGAVELIDATLRPHGHDFDALASRLTATLPHLIALPYNPHDTANHMTALVQDIIARVDRARVAAAAIRKMESSVAASMATKPATRWENNNSHGGATESTTTKSSADSFSFKPAAKLNGNATPGQVRV